MECFQSHLSGWLTNRLRCHCTASFTRHHHCSLVLLPDELNKLIELKLSDVSEIPQKLLISKLGLQVCHLLGNVLNIRLQSRDKLE